MSRIIIDIATNKVLQVEKTPDEGELRTFNGRYAIPIPPGADVDVDASSYVLPQDGGDLAALAAAALLAQYPMYSNVTYNYLLEAADVDDIDLAGTGPSGEVSRIITGRGGGPSPGQVPNTTAILAQNDGAAVAQPGALITDTIDIGPATSGAGADEFMLWWHLYDFDNTQDIASDFGATSGSNVPCFKRIAEADQEPTAMDVYVSNDDGSTWTLASRLEPTDLGVFDTDVRLAFINAGATRLNLAAYAVMF